MATMLEVGRQMVRGERELFPVARLVGLVLKAIEPGRAVFEMQADGRHHNPLGTLHGGIYCDLADAAMGWAYAATLAEGESFTTVEMKINFLPGSAGGDPDRRGEGRESRFDPGVRRVRGQGRAGPAGGEGGEHLHETEAGVGRMRFAKWVFLVAGVSGILMVAPMYLEDRFFADFPPAINRPEFFYGFAGVTLAWQFMFLVIGSNPIRYRTAMLPAMLEKASFAIAIPILYAADRVGGFWLFAAAMDATWPLLFVVAYLRTPKEPPHGGKA